MNTTALRIHLPPRYHWREARQKFTVWRHHACSRRELVDLSDRCLQDIGISRCSTNFEAAKPFWMA